MQRGQLFGHDRARSRHSHQIDGHGLLVRECGNRLHILVQNRAVRGKRRGKQPAVPAAHDIAQRISALRLAEIGVRAHERIPPGKVVGQIAVDLSECAAVRDVRQGKARRLCEHALFVYGKRRTRQQPERRLHGD